MTQETVNVKVDVTQVIDGREYKGNISFDDINFQYQLRFGVPLNRLDELAQRSPEEVMRQIYLDVTDAKGRAVPLDDKAKALFIATAGRLAIEFYNNPQTRDSQEGFLGMAVRGEGLFGSGGLGISASIGMSTEYKFPRIPELEKFLETYRE